jgi:hypothetical protein
MAITVPEGRCDATRDAGSFVLLTRDSPYAIKVEE